MFSRFSNFAFDVLHCYGLQLLVGAGKTVYTYSIYAHLISLVKLSLLCLVSNYFKAANFIPNNSVVIDQLLSWQATSNLLLQLVAFDCYTLFVACNYVLQYCSIGIK